MKKKRYYRKQHRFKRKKSIFRNRFFWLGILSLIILSTVFYLTCFYSFFQIKNIEIEKEQTVLSVGVKMVSQETIEIIDLILRESIAKKILFFPTKSIFLVNSEKIEKTILARFFQLAEIQINKQFPDTLSVFVSQRKGVALVFQEDRYFLIDKEGIFFERVDELELLKIKNFDLEAEPKLAKQIIEKELLTKLLTVESSLNNLKIPIKEISIISETRFNVETVDGWSIYFNPKEDLDWQLTKLKVVLDEKIPEEERGDLEYIELRFGNRAPYK